MNDDQNTVQNIDAGPGDAAPPAMPGLPDGIGLGYDEVAELLRKQSNVAISPDDPIMMLIPVCNALLTQEKALLEAHQKALGAIMSEKTGKFVGNVRAVSDELGKTFSSSVVKSLQEAFETHTKAMLAHGDNIKRLAWIAGGCAVFCAGTIAGLAIAIWK